MGLFGDIAGIFTAGRAAKSISDANIAAEHGVLGEKDKAQTGVAQATGDANTNVNAAGQTAIAGVNAATANANGTLADTLKSQTNNLNPYLQAGQQGVSSLADYAASKPTFSFNPTDLQNDPGYKFQLEQGTNAIQNNASASGLGASGNAAKALQSFGTGLAGTYYQQAYDRAKGTFDTNQNATLANLSALTGAGLSASGQFNAASQNAGNQQAQNTMTAGLVNGNTTTSLAQYLGSLGLKGAEDSGNFGLKGAEDAGNFAVGAGTAHAAGVTGTGTAIGNGIGDLAGIVAGIPGIGKTATGILGRA